MKLIFNTPMLPSLAAACAGSPVLVAAPASVALASAARVWQTRTPLAAHISARRPQGPLSTVHAERGTTTADASIALTDSKAMSKGALGYLNQGSEAVKLGGFRGTPPRGRPV